MNEPKLHGTGAAKVLARLFGPLSTRTDWLTYGDLAAELKVRSGHLKALVARGELPCVRVGRLVRFFRPAVYKALVDRAK